MNIDSIQRLLLLQSRLLCIYLSLFKIDLGKVSGSVGKFFGVECDLAKDEDIQKMFNWIKNHPELGQVDVCICNAGQIIMKSALRIS